MGGLVWAWRPGNQWSYHGLRHTASGILPASAAPVNPHRFARGPASGAALSAIESEVWEAVPRKASGGKYWSKQGWRTDHRIYISGGFAAADIRPLDEIYAPKILALPYVVQQLCRGEFWDRVGSATWPEKNAAAAWLSESVESFSGARLDVAYDFEEIESRARRSAQICRHIPTYEGINEYAKSKGIDLPEPKGGRTLRGCIARSRSHKWWRRRFSKLYRRSAEAKLRASGFVRRHRGLYASSFALSARRQQAAATERYLRERTIRSDTGEQLNLFDVWKGSTANPAIRRAELMTRMSGFEATAREAGHVAEFITLTTPSRFHAMNSDGTANANYCGATVREGQAWLNLMWSRARAKLKKLSMLVYGFRVAEPHHDATPHWHMVLFARKDDIETLRTVLREYWLSDSGSEPGALHHRIKFEPINYSKGSATGYLSKYIAKNIDGFEVGEDYEATGANDGRIRNSHPDTERSDIRSGTDPEPAIHAKAKSKADAAATAPRVGAWAALHGIRQFQQIGGPQVTIYRELRRSRSVDVMRPSGPAVDDSEYARKSAGVVAIERARVQADAGNWSGFIACNGGIAAGRKGLLALWKEIKVDKATGETRSNSYGEAEGPKIVGVASALGNLRTRLKTWRIEKVEGGEGGSEWVHKEARKLRVFSVSALGPVSITVALPMSEISRSALQSGLARHFGETYGWTNPNETSMYGPN
jgi:hypothetical protein